MTQGIIESSDKTILRRSPGYLMAPFGWAAKPVIAMLEADPSLCPALFTLGRPRMHLIALALAHCAGEIDLSFAQLVIIGDPAAVLDAVLGRRPKGLKRALSHLPFGVLPRLSYQHLVELLEQLSTAKLIYRTEGLCDEYIEMLHSVPAPLRRVVALLAEEGLGRHKGFAEGLRLLAARGAAPSYDALIADLAAIREPAQFVARIAKLVEQLPLHVRIDDIQAELPAKDQGRAGGRVFVRDRTTKNTWPMSLAGSETIAEDEKWPSRS